MPATSRRKQRLHRSWAASWNNGQVDALDEILDTDYRRRCGARSDDRQELKRIILAVRDGFADLHTNIEDVVEEGDQLAIRWRCAGTHDGEFLGVPPTKRHAEVCGVTFVQFVGDRIVEEWSSWRPEQLLESLGIHTIGNPTRPAASR
jgi:steroid delta-isomerase-like uncharacterized protein